MPPNAAVPVTPSPFVSRRGEVPLTLVLDAERALTVEVLRAPDVSSESGLSALVSFAESSQADFPPLAAHGRDIPRDIAEGRVLWQSAEVVDWIVRLSGLERVMTHQLVRQRVGVTYSQQCTGDRDCRHETAVVPRAYARPGFEDRRRSYVEETLRAKLEYAADVDAGICIGEARRRLPQSLSTFLNVRWCVTSLVEMYKKRRDPMTQDWLMYVLAGKIRDAVVAESPWMENVLRPAPAKGSYYERIKRVGYTATHLWSPAGTDHDDYEWNPETFEHGALSHEELSSGPEQPPELYLGAELLAAGLPDVAAALRRLGDEDRLRALRLAYGAEAVDGL